jgi:exodeoxyribonuclease V gamma subunit
LLDYAEQGFSLTREQLVTRHRLQAFHESYFQPDGRLFSFSAENCRASQSARQPDAIRTPFLNTPLSEPEPEFRQITLDELTAFFCNPATFLLQRRLHVRLRNADGALDEREPFDLDARDGYPLKQQLLQDRLAGVDPTQTLAQVAAAGVLPLGQVGQARSQSLSASVDDFWQRLRPFDPLRVGAVLDLDLVLGGFRLTGRLTPRAVGGVLGYRVASIKAPDILRLWVQHLAAGAAGRGGESILVGADTTHRYRPCEEASAKLEQLLQLYWQGLRQPLKFFPRSSRAFAEAEHKLATNPKSRARPLADALKQWEGNEFNHVSPERDDLSFNLCFGEESPLDEEFVTLARQVFAPVLQHETEEEA